MKKLHKFTRLLMNQAIRCEFIISSRNEGYVLLQYCLATFY